MANIYVRSTDGNNSDSGATWALAKANLTGAAAIDAAGDVIYVSQSHAESTASAVTIALAGSLSNPVTVICGNDSAEPPTSSATSASVTTTSGNISLSGSAYFYGISFISAGALNLNNGNAHSTQYYESCGFTTTNIGSSGRSTIGSSTNFSYKTILKNCTFTYGSATQYLMAYGDVIIEGGGFSGSVTPSPFFTLPLDRSAGEFLINGFDFSGCSSTFNIFNAGAINSGLGVLRNCRLPAGWSGSLVSSGTIQPGQRYEMYNCDGADTNYRVWIVDSQGSLVDETTIVRTGGASDGTTPLSWKLTTVSNCSYPNNLFYTPEIARWNTTVGSPVTVTVEIITDGLTVTDKECWLELQYQGTSGFPRSLFSIDRATTPINSATNQTSSSVAWTTTGLSSPIKQKLSVTVTPEEVGFFLARIIVARPTTTVYVDPKLDIT